jgi:phage terminase small subunit
MALTVQQRLFVNAYLRNNGNGSRAASEAGYACPEIAASRLLRIVKVKRCIENRLEKVAMSADEVLIRLSRLAAVDATNFISLTNGKAALDLAKAKKKDNLCGVKEIKETSHEREGITSTTVEVKIDSPLKALELLAKYHGILTDKIELKNSTQDVTKMTDEELAIIAASGGSGT